MRIYSGTLHLRDVIRISEKEKIKITEMCVPTNGELYSSDTACSGDIVILPNDVLQLNSILGNGILLPQRKFIENPLPMLQTTIAVKKSEYFLFWGKCRWKSFVPSLRKNIMWRQK